MRFALSIPLVFALIVSVQSVDTSPTAEEQTVMTSVSKLRGKADIDPKLPASARVSAKFDSADDTLLAKLAKMPQIGSLDVFDAGRCTEKGFAALKGLPHLRSLIIGKSDMTPARAEAVGECKQLRLLYLGEAGLNDAELAGLKTLTLLESLDISGNTQITDKGMETVKTLERLQSLSIAKTGVTNQGLMELKVLDGLRSLYVGGSKITGDAADKFAEEMPNLRAVRR